MHLKLIFALKLLVTSKASQLEQSSKPLFTSPFLSYITRSGLSSYDVLLWLRSISGPRRSSGLFFDTFALDDVEFGLEASEL